MEAMHHVKEFRCYVRSVASAITVDAQSHEEAAFVAAEMMGWNEADVVTRYVVTKINGGRPEWRERGRMNGMKAMKISEPLVLGECVAARSSGKKAMW